MFSTHNRSGEITYKRIAPFTVTNGTSTYQVYNYEITVVKYTDDDTPPLNSGQQNEVLDRCLDTLYFGDGQKETVERMNGVNPLLPGLEPCNCIRCGEIIINENGYRVKKNIYKFYHQYPGPGNYLLRTTDPNRNNGVINMNSSGLQPFYLESLLVISSLSGPNNSPVFTVDPVDKACIGKCFTHNPGAYDPDNDSLSFKLSTPKSGVGQTVLGYVTPKTQAGGTFSIDPRSGTLSWCNPVDQGEYNIAFVVQEWRKNTSDSMQLVGTVLRDMQVVVRTCPNNDPPSIIVPQDTCVEAGTLIHKKITVSDPDLGNTVTLTGFGGAFSVPSPVAVLTNTSAVMSGANGKKFTADFSWQTSCSHISRQFYLTTFKAEDDATNQKLATYNVYKIRVVPPSVKGLVASATGTAIKLDWTASVCNPTNNPLMGYKIYRKDGCVSFTAQPCQTGIPSSSGFVLIGKINSKTSSFTDDNNGNGLVVGQFYSYLVIAYYYDDSESSGGLPVCAKLKRDVPVIVNVDVLSTSSSSGSVRVRWSRPLKTSGNFDSLAFPGPYRFDLKHKEGNGFVIVFSTVRDFLFELDTVFDHKNLNTLDSIHEYQVDFTAGTTKIGASAKATSVFLKLSPSDRRVDLAWSSKTPWKNYNYIVYRKNPASLTYSPIATTSTTGYSDLDNIANKNTYCYYVTSEGNYSDPSIAKPLLNRSQEACAFVKDLTKPCTPTLSVEADCKTGFVAVRWKNIRPLCSDDVVNYYLYYKNTLDEPYQKVFETDSTFYLYDGLDLFSGCYAIQSVDSSGNLSQLSQDFCIDNCPEFELPNIFSPNGDGSNDFFKAIKVRQVKEINLIIVDRWGNLMYKSRDPLFQWDGANMNNKQQVSEGTFFYVCEVFEPRLTGITKRILKGSVQVVR